MSALGSSKAVIQPRAETEITAGAGPPISVVSRWFDERILKPMVAFGKSTLLAALFFAVSPALLCSRETRNASRYRDMTPVSNAKGYFKCLTVQPKIRSLQRSAVALQLL
jgi:hypothetical protein